MVLLGDPRRPDSVKRNGQLNAEDIDTVVRLQSALATIEPYAFYYVDDHHILIRRLDVERPRLVFNLCDEGFHNRPDMELPPIQGAARRYEVGSLRVHRDHALPCVTNSQ